jgi:hypothetical protein
MIFLHARAYKGLLILLLLSSLSCHRSNKIKTLEERVEPTDLGCIEEINKAKAEIWYSHRLVYCDFMGSFGSSRVHLERERAFILRSHGIGYQTAYSSDVPTLGKEIDNCYCKFMQERINEKFGNVFIDSLLHIADSLAMPYDQEG